MILFNTVKKFRNLMDCGSRTARLHRHGSMISVETAWPQAGLSIQEMAK